jgi:phosphoribosylformimino-5-aminoimidazole carboxamide ribotide isomerase
MLVIPAIDLMDGEAVRLEKGDFATKKVYAKDPAEKAAEFRGAGATLLHLVDLDGARAGWPVNLDTVAAICRVKGIEVELGGGLRTLADIEKVFALGVSYVVLGTAAVERLDLVLEACRRFPGRVRTGIDARNGEVKIAGWLEGTGMKAVDVARRVKAAGVSLVEYTDVARDGMFTGVDADGAARLQAEAGMDVIASGGVASQEDVTACKTAGLAGVIVGKAIYEGRLDLAKAVRLGASALTVAPGPGEGGGR